MTVDFSNANKVMFMRYEYIKSTLAELPEEWLVLGAGTPSANHMFSVGPGSEKLAEKDASRFHHNIAK